MTQNIYNLDTSWYCPGCEQMVKGFPAISRKDNKTEICSDCGVQEAMMDLTDAIWERKHTCIECGTFTWSKNHICGLCGVGEL